MVLESIDNGMTSSILYEIRVYRLGKGLLKNLVRSLVYSEDIVYEGNWDPFLQSYLISRNGELSVFTSSSEFLDRFFSVRNYSIIMAPQPGKKYEVHVKSMLSAVKLLPPLNFMTPFMRLKPGGRQKCVYEIQPDSGGGK